MARTQRDPAFRAGLYQEAVQSILDGELGTAKILLRAAAYSLIQPAKLNELDPEDYLRQILQRIADHPAKHVHELLPWNLTSIRARLDQRNAA